MNARLLNYYPFGSQMVGRFWRQSGSEYSYGFNGQLKEDNITDVEGGHIVFEYRIQDTRLGRFLSVDPLSKEYPWNSSYAFAENDVIRSIDLEGREKKITTENFYSDKGGSIIRYAPIKTRAQWASPGPGGTTEGSSHYLRSVLDVISGHTGNKERTYQLLNSFDNVNWISGKSEYMNNKNYVTRQFGAVGKYLVYRQVEVYGPPNSGELNLQVTYKNGNIHKIDAQYTPKDDGPNSRTDAINIANDMSKAGKAFTYIGLGMSSLTGGSGSPLIGIGKALEWGSTYVKALIYINDGEEEKAVGIVTFKYASGKVTGFVSTKFSSATGMQDDITKILKKVSTSNLKLIKSPKEKKK